MRGDEKKPSTKIVTFKLQLSTWFNNIMILIFTNYFLFTLNRSLPFLMKSTIWFAAAIPAFILASAV